MWISGEERRFALYHDSLRAFLSSVDAARTSFRSELAEAVTEAHHVIADYYLASWGGLDTNLQRLATEAVEPDGYGIRSVATHLATVGRGSDLHLLLACEHDGRNVWYTIHDRRHDMNGYLKDIDIAATIAGSDVGALIRYRLIAAAVTSHAAEVPADLVTAMVDVRMWTTALALGVAARGMPDKEADRLLRTLAPRFTDEQCIAALDLVAGFTDDDPRCSALVGLVPHLPEPLLDRVLEMAAAVAPEIERRTVLAALAPHCREALKPVLVQHIKRLDSAMFRVEALTDILPYLDGPLRADALDAARAAVGEVNPPGWRVLARHQLATCTEPEESLRLVREGLAIARALDESDRFHALTSLARFTPEPLRTEMLTEARQAPPIHGVRILAALARQSAGDAATALLHEAYRLAGQLDDHDRLKALAGLVPHAPGSERASWVAEAIAAAGFTEPPHSLVAQARLADRYLDAEARDEVFDQLWLRCTELSQEWEQHLVVRDWAHRFPATQALGMVRAWQHPMFRVNGLIALARAVPDDQRYALLREAYAIATELGDMAEQARARAALLPYLSERPRVAATAAILADAERSWEGLAALRHLPAALPERRNLAEQAVSRAHSAHGYVALAGLLEGDTFGQLLDGVASIKDPWERLNALMDIAPHVPPAHLDRYIQISRALSGDGLWMVGQITAWSIYPAMNGNITILPHGIHAGPLAAALAHPAIDTDRARELRAEAGAALALQARRLTRRDGREDRLVRTDLGAATMLAAAAYQGDEDTVWSVVAAAEVMSFRWTLAEALTALAPTLNPERRQQVQQDALRLFESIPLSWDQDGLIRRGMGKLLAQLPEPDRNAAVNRWFAEVIRECEGLQQATALGEIAAHLPTRLLQAAADAAGTIHSYDQRMQAHARAAALAALAQVWRGDPAPLEARVDALPDAATKGQVVITRLRSGAAIPVGQWPSPTTRAMLLDLVAAAAWSFEDAADEVFRALQDVTRWWP